MQWKGFEEGGGLEGGVGEGVVQGRCGLVHQDGGQRQQMHVVSTLPHVTCGQWCPPIRGTVEA